VLLIKPPFFSPWTPPLGIGILKTYLEKHGHSVKCYDFNVDPELWGTHHKYFGLLQTMEDISIHDGYSKLWFIINAHMLAYVNGADQAACAKVLETIIPIYGIRYDERVASGLLPIVEKYFRRLDELIDKAGVSDFTVVGTSTYTTSLASSLFTLKKVKQRYPWVATVMGGGVFNDDLALGSDNLDTLINECAFVDHIIIGEGEQLFLSLLEGKLSGQRLISRAENLGPSLDIKDVPIPNFSDFDLSCYYHLSLEGGRSCPFQCSFCSETVQWGTYRKRPRELFAQQIIELASTYNNNSFFLGDSLMNPYIGEFSSELLKRHANILYDGYLRADKPVIHRDRVRTWARSGLYRVRLGIESASARVLDAMDKMTTPKTISEVLKSLANAGVRPTTYWIVGFPGETRADFEETLNFIREHHRFIYELEAHPHYYYPYGQVGSRLYQSCSLYPEEVTRFTRFKEWEIVDCQPSRAEKYHRLREVSELAASLGLPNIYTMSERYDAEERWHRLHPLTIEVYEGTSLNRGEVSPRSEPLPVFSEEWRQRRLPPNGNHSAVAYHIHVTKLLNEAVLAQAARALVRHNEMLQVSLGDGFYHANRDGQINGKQDNEILTVYEQTGEAISNMAHSEVLDTLAKQIQPAAGSSFRVGLIKRSEQACDILVLVHKAIADGPSTILLCEQLFRAYEQLAEQRPLSLAPVKKSYAALVDEMPAANQMLDAEFSSSINEHDDYSAATILLPNDLGSRMLGAAPQQDQPHATELLVSAVLTCAARANVLRTLAVDVKLDYRRIDVLLAETVGSLTCVHRAPDLATPYDDPVRVLENTMKTLRRNSTGKLAERNGDGLTSNVPAMLLNLEYLNEPWLGGDEWIPKGFILHDSVPNKSYALLATPHLSERTLKLNLRYKNEAAVEALVAYLQAHLVEEIDWLRDGWDSYLAAGKFWRTTLGDNPLVCNFESAEALSDDRSSMRFGIESSLVEKLSESCAADPATIILCAYGVLLSKLSGKQVTFILADMAHFAATVPLKLRPSDNLRFQDFTAQASAVSEAARPHSGYACQILADSKWINRVAPLPFDTGYIYGRSQPDQQFNKITNFSSAGAQGLSLVLAAFPLGSNFEFEFLYRTARFDSEAIGEIAAHLSTILRQASMNTSIRLGDMLVAETVTPDEKALAADAGVAFNF